MMRHLKTISMVLTGALLTSIPPVQNAGMPEDSQLFGFNFITSAEATSIPSESKTVEQLVQFWSVNSSPRLVGTHLMVGICP